MKKKKKKKKKKKEKNWTSSLTFDLKLNVKKAEKKRKGELTRLLMEIKFSDSFSSV